MTQQEFENRVLSLWMTTRVPLTRANVLFYTRAPRKRAEAWLDAMAREGVLDVDSDDEGEMVWSVRGAARPAHGPERIDELARLERLSAEVERTRRRAGGDALVPSPAAGRGIVERAIARRGGRKSAIASGALSLFFGPLGWMYAGPVREALPAAIVYYIVVRLIAVLPALLAGPLFSLLALASVAAGLIYAWQYNQRGEVTPLLGGGDDEEGRPRLPGRR